MFQRLKFNANYSERLHLSDGTQLLVRLVKASDKQLLNDGFEHLSSKSRYQRFFIAKKSLSDQELAYFTETDCVNHFALGAVVCDANGDEREGAGIARFIRSDTEHDVAEVAITVVDHMQRHGVGKLLLERLLEAARERKIKRLRFECLAQNHEVQKLIFRACRVVETSRDGEVLMVETRLPDRSRFSAALFHAITANIYALFRAVAAQTLEASMELGFDAFDQSLEAANRNGELLLKALHSEKHGVRHPRVVKCRRADDCAADRVDA